MIRVPGNSLLERCAVVQMADATRLDQGVEKISVRTVTFRPGVLILFVAILTLWVL